MDLRFRVQTRDNQFGHILNESIPLYFSVLSLKYNTVQAEFFTQSLCRGEHLQDHYSPETSIDKSMCDCVLNREIHI